MHLKYPSLLKFDQDCLNDADKLHNLKALYAVEKVPSDSRLRELLDPIETRYLRKFFTTLFAYVQRSGRLKQFEYFEEGYLAPIDGTHNSTGRCLKKRLRANRSQKTSGEHCQRAPAPAPETGAEF